MAKKKTAKKAAPKKARAARPPRLKMSEQAAEKLRPLAVAPDEVHLRVITDEEFAALVSRVNTLEAELKGQGDRLDHHVSQLATSIGTIQEKVAPYLVGTDKFGMRVATVESGVLDITHVLDTVQKALVAINARVGVHQERLDELKKFDQYIYDAVKRHEEERHPEAVTAKDQVLADPAPKQPLDVVAVPSLAERADLALKEEKEKTGQS